MWKLLGDEQELHIEEVNRLREEVIQVFSIATQNEQAPHDL